MFFKVNLFQFGDSFLNVRIIPLHGYVDAVCLREYVEMTLFQIQDVQGDLDLSVVGVLLF